MCVLFKISKKASFRQNKVEIFLFITYNFILFLFNEYYIRLNTSTIIHPGIMRSKSLPLTQPFHLSVQFGYAG